MRDGDAWRAVHRLRSGARDSAEEPQGEAKLTEARRLARAVSRVLGLVPGDSRCLFRSLTLLRMLERRGIGQTLVIAVRPGPLAAHAWIEVDGRPVLPGADAGYERLLEL
jgi:Transglutaminase-like superfamily